MQMNTKVTMKLLIKLGMLTLCLFLGIRQGWANENERAYTIYFIQSYTEQTPFQTQWIEGLEEGFKKENLMSV